MKDTTIQIRYGDKFGANAGCTTVRLPAWLEQAPLPKIKGLLKLAARKAAEDPNNAGEILRLEAYITTAIAEAEAELKVAEAINESRARAAEIRRVKNWIERLRKIREGFTAALDKYYPTRK